MHPQLKKILIIGAPILLRKLFRGGNFFKKFGIFLLVLIVGSWVYVQYQSTFTQQTPGAVSTKGNKSAQAEQSDIRSLFDTQRSGIVVSTAGNVTRILKDDNDGSRHQRFLIQIPDGLTLLVAHNIDLAPRVPLSVNDKVAIHGQYEWGNKGGVLHWTHLDPQKKHPGGWIIHQGKKYE